MKIEKDGWSYYDKLPEGFRVAKLDDFIRAGRRRIGMMFLIRWSEKEIYQECLVSENLTSVFLKPFIEENRVFVKQEP